MLSRFTRMSSLGAHLASSGCSVLKEPTPSKPVAKVDSSRWNSSFRVSVEKRWVRVKSKSESSFLSSVHQEVTASIDNRRD